LHITERFCSRHTTILLERSLHMRGLASLFYGSADHCAQVVEDDIRNWVEAINVLADPRMSCWARGEDKLRMSLLLISELCALLTPILLYGLPSVNLALLNEDRLLVTVPTAIRGLLNAKHIDEDRTNMCIRFYSQFVQSKCKQEELADITDDIEEQSLSDAKTTEQTVNASAPLNLSQDLISSYFDLYRQIQTTSLFDQKSIQQEQIQTLFNQEWKKLNVVKLKDDYEQLKKHQTSLKDELSQLKNELQRTQSERDQFRKENMRMAQEIDNLKLRPVSSVTEESQQTSMPVAADKNNQDNTVDELQALSPHEITVEQAEKCIREIHHRRTTFNDHDMRKSICGSLKHLGSDLYSSPVHFLHELIQVILFIHVLSDYYK
jgi:hypothetical protein